MQGVFSYSGWGDKEDLLKARGMKVRTPPPPKVRVNKVGDFSSYDKHIPPPHPKSSEFPKALSRINAYGEST